MPHTSSGRRRIDDEKGQSRFGDDAAAVMLRTQELMGRWRRSTGSDRGDRAGRFRSRLRGCYRTPYGVRPNSVAPHYAVINHSCRGSAPARETGIGPRAISVKRLKFYELAILFRYTVRNDRRTHAHIAGHCRRSGLVAAGRRNALPRTGGLAPRDRRKMPPSNRAPGVTQSCWPIRAPSGAFRTPGAAGSAMIGETPE
jgi:hypothetical protein